ncbi:hypothetical protein QR680_012192 [Steinernema hermaphroditum]|uniref:Uncharacterized protein n=1 Tax=Steinernema hermaphroditum TaxID=289476 RepID=A0AA39M044_9BILA|nr:hypothetical protein QR680_012192 [Steinernema hermaphroditum]
MCLRNLGEKLRSFIQLQISVKKILLVEPSDSRRLYRGATYEQKIADMGKRNVFIISEAEESSDSDFAMFVDLKIRTGEGSNQLPFHPYRRPPETEGESRTTEKECEKTMS